MVFTSPLGIHRPQVANTRGIVSFASFWPVFLDNTIPRGILSKIFENPRGILTKICTSDPLIIRSESKTNMTH